MSRVRGRDTKPEMVIRLGLHARGLRYRLHDKSLPGRPDLVFAKYRTVVFVHGCFWHAHGCNRSKVPATRRHFWKQKLEGNAVRDQRAVAALHACGWRILIVWECAFRGPGSVCAETVVDRAAAFIRNEGPQYLEIASEQAELRCFQDANCA